MKSAHLPLASRLRPVQLADYIGQSHLVGEGRILAECVKRGVLHSMILWGPAGTGKTTLARILARSIGAEVEELSAVSSGVKEIRAFVDRASERRQLNQKTVLFVDEVHRFSKSQQDAFLPYIEQGLFVFIGATTENPSFELNKALLSRARVHVLKPLTNEELISVIDRALQDQNDGFGNRLIQFSSDLKQMLCDAACGDARRILNWLESLIEIADKTEGVLHITSSHLREIIGTSVPQYDKGGEIFYDVISALHKSIRGSDPDASLYWLCRMLVGGVEPLYIARRLVRVASEDIGNADPRALTIALNAWDVQERLGSPEGELALAQAAVFMACAAKSNAVYKAYNQAKAEAALSQLSEVPIHLRNAPTKLMKQLGYGKDYRYPHDFPHAYIANETYLPEKVKGGYYKPTDRGLEKQISEKITFLKQLDKGKY